MLNDFATRGGVTKLKGKVTNSIPQEVAFVNRCLELLAPGGRMGIVLPDGVLANSSMQGIRNWILSWARLKAVVSLPQETFAPYGAGVKTSVVFLEKRDHPLHQGEEDTGTWTRYEYAFDAEGQIHANAIVHNGGVDYQVYMAKIEDIGYDANGRLSVSEDEAHNPTEVREAVADYMKFSASQ